MATKKLVVYFSWSGNLDRMAHRLAQVSGADLFRIERKKPYSKVYPVCAAAAKKEIEQNQQLELAGDVPNFDQYDVVFVGYPVWWYTIPQPVRNFIERHDWTGKTVYTFNSHMGSGEGGTTAVVRGYAKGADVRGNMNLSDSEAKRDLSPIDSWYSSLNLD